MQNAQPSCTRLDSIPGTSAGELGVGEEEEEEATEMGKASGSWKKKKSRESCPAGQKKKAQMTSLETGMNAFKESPSTKTLHFKNVF